MIFGSCNWTQLSCQLRFVSNKGCDSAQDSYLAYEPSGTCSPVMSVPLSGQALVTPSGACGFQADQDRRPSGAALPSIDLSVVRSVGSTRRLFHKPVPDRIGRLATGDQAEGPEHLPETLPSGGQSLRGVRLALRGGNFTAVVRGPEVGSERGTDRHGSRQESHPLLG